MLQFALADLEPASTAPDTASGLVRLMNAVPVLMVLDNLDTLPPDEQRVLARFLRNVPQNGSRVFLTARSKLLGFDDVRGAYSRTLTTGLDEYSGALHAFHYARLKDVKALLYEFPRVAEGGRVEGKCALVARRLSGHPRMIELAVGVAGYGWEELERSLKTLSGNLEEQLRWLLETGLKLVGQEGQALLSFLPFFESGKFMQEEMVAVAGASGQKKAAGDAETDSALEESANGQIMRAVERGLDQLARAGLFEFEQVQAVYTFHQSLLDHLGRQPATEREHARLGLLALLAFHADYVGNHRGDDAAIDRCVENILATLEITWGMREEGSPFDSTTCAVIDGLGDYFERRGLWQLGQHWLERAIALRRSLTPAPDQAALSWELYQLSQVLYRRGELANARELLLESIAVFEELADRAGRAASVHQLAVIEHAQGKSAEARRLLRESIAVREELGDGRGRAASLHQLAIIEHTQGNLLEARRLLRESIALLAELGDRRGRAASLHQLAVIEHAQGNLLEARRLLRESIAVNEEVGDPRGRAASMHRLAIIEHDQGNPVEARKLLRESIAVLEDIGDRQGRAASLYQLAIIEHAQGNPVEARRLLQESLGALEELGDRQGRAASLHELAAIEHDQGNPVEARRLLRESIAVLEELGDRQGRAASLYQLAIIEHAQGNLVEAPGSSKSRSECWRNWATARVEPPPCMSWPPSSTIRGIRQRHAGSYASRSQFLKSWVTLAAAPPPFTNSPGLRPLRATRQRHAGSYASRSQFLKSWATARAEPPRCTNWPSSSTIRANRPRHAGSYANRS